MKYFRVTYCIGMVVLCAIVAFSIYKVQNSPYFTWLAYLGMFSSAILLILAVIVGLIFTLNLWYDAQVIPVEQWGAYLKRRNKLTPLPPLLPAQPKVAGATSVTELKPNIPRLADLIAANLLIKEEEGQALMLQGFRSDESPRYGTWPGVIAITGMQNVGKTVTMTTLIVIALLQGAHVVVCDTHHTKARSLFKKIQALRGYLTIATTEEEVLRETKRFSNELAARKSGSAPYPYVIFYDELCSLIRAKNEELKEALPTTMEEASQEGHGYELHMVASIHDMSNSGIGDARLRTFWNFVYCHRMEQGQSKFVEAFKGKYGTKKTSMVIAGLPVGHTMSRDEVNEIEYLIMPEAGSKDVLVAMKKMQEIEPISKPEMLISKPEMTVSHERETDSFHFISQIASSKMEPEMKRNETETMEPLQPISIYEKRKREVRRYLTTNPDMTETAIIEYLWNVKAGGSQSYKEARDEFKQMKREVLAEMQVNA